MESRLALGCRHLENPQGPPTILEEPQEPPAPPQEALTSPDEPQEAIASPHEPPKAPSPPQSPQHLLRSPQRPLHLLRSPQSPVETEWHRPNSLTSESQQTTQASARPATGGTSSVAGATETEGKLKQYLEDERIALFLQNEEFMRELQLVQEAGHDAKTRIVSPQNNAVVI
ncbi:CUE domain-containing protein 1 [Merluccius polli]|uniref:CUE domain-containing protein 1 n=1 Tax=Merluccius polli TaxID=89951 RepID=A0AA47N2M4_MERPO|nr:CUE domain-containing protein 1 [Merluccius polli]